MKTLHSTYPQLGARVPVWLNEVIQAEAQRRGVSTAEVVRLAIRRYAETELADKS